MLRDVVRFGTATRALVLKRPDIAGKTGTTNRLDRRLVRGYQSKLVGIAWIGYDQPKNLGNKETGGGLALPILDQLYAKGAEEHPDRRARGAGRRDAGGRRVLLHRKPTGTGVPSLEGASHAPSPDEKSRDAVKNELF